MTREKRNYKLKKYIACLKCEVSGKCCDDNCPTQYDAGNMGEIIENLEAISKILEQEPKTGHWVHISFNGIGHMYSCSECGRLLALIDKDQTLKDYPYCHCGSKNE